MSNHAQLGTSRHAGLGSRVWACSVQSTPSAASQTAAQTPAAASALAAAALQPPAAGRPIDMGFGLAAVMRVGGLI